MHFQPSFFLLSAWVRGKVVYSLSLSFHVCKVGWKYSPGRTAERVKWGKVYTVLSPTRGAWRYHNRQRPPIPYTCPYSPCFSPHLPLVVSSCLPPNFLFSMYFSLIISFLFTEKEFIKWEQISAQNLGESQSIQRLVFSSAFHVFFVCILWRARNWGLQRWSGSGVRNVLLNLSLWREEAKGLTSLPRSVYFKGADCLWENASVGSFVLGQAVLASYKPP